MNPALVVVLFDNRQPEKVDEARIIDLARRTVVSEAATGEISLTLVGPKEMAGLNRTYRGLEGPTDVLSFPVDGRQPQLLPAEADCPPTLIGEVVICPQVANQARGALAEEIDLLVVHGVLHLLGYDHLTQPEAEVMAAREFDLIGRSGAKA